MKKTSIILGMLTIGLFASAQRLVLFEEFTGENCGPCASTNPVIDALMAQPSNTVKIQPIKWQVAIPSAPTATWSLYQTNSTEANSRRTYYNANSAPFAWMDGIGMQGWGAASNNAGYLTQTRINTANAVATPFSMSVNATWDGTFDNAVVTVTITSSAAFTANGNLKMRLVLVEKEINFPTPPGSNGEKDFHYPVRKSYPNITNGTALPNSWTNGQIETYTINCAAPSYIYSKGEMMFVAFVQDDGDKKVYQVGRTSTPSIPNEASATSANLSSNVTCNATVMPTATLKNNGANAITDMTVTPYLNSMAGTPVVWTGMLAPGASTTINMGVESNIINGTNTYSYMITGVSGGDIVQNNNSAKTTFFSSTVFGANPPSEGFVNPVFPGTGWGVFNNNLAPHSWLRATTAGGFGTSSEAIRLFINWTPNNGTHDLYMPGVTFTGTLNPEVKFDMSYTQITTANNDKLEVQVSTNCGQTWATEWANQGSAMATTPVNNSQMNIPTASQWVAVTVPLTSYSNTPEVLVRFKATSNQGNVIWLDNININNVNTTGIAQIANTTTGFEVYPNPAANEVNISITSANAASSQIKITNTLGQLVSTKAVSLNAGQNTVQIDTKELANGIYYVTYGSGQGAVTKKLTIAK